MLFILHYVEIVKSLINVFKINFIVNTGDVCEDGAPVFN